MAPIELFEPERITRRGHDGFFAYFLQALIQEAGAKPTQEPRPVPQLRTPRLHESCWVRFGDRLVCFDMSDHMQLLDTEAIRQADVYFKANLNRPLAARVLAAAGLRDHAAKLRPFLFFSDQLDWFLRIGALNRKLDWLPGRKDVAHVVGVYENAVRDGGTSPFHGAADMSPASCHFWARKHTQDAFISAGLSGTYRLVSRGNPALEDHKTVFPNLSRRRFAWALARSEAVVVNTLPHALFPWKVSESLALGRPVILDVPPVTEVPEFFRLTEGEHVLTLLPPVPLSTEAPLDSHRSYRAIPSFAVDAFHQGVERIREVLHDKPRLREMQDQCRRFARRAYTPARIAQYICDTVDGAAP